jgi:hypothetical protein
VVAGRRTEIALPAIAAAAAATTTAAAATTTAAAVIAAAAAAAAPITTAAAATATATVATATAAAAAAALLALLGFVHTKRSTVEGLTVHGLHGLGRFFSGAHGHEREAAGAAGLAIGDEVDVADCAELLECSANAISGRVERKVSYIETGVHRLLNRPSDRFPRLTMGLRARKRGFELFPPSTGTDLAVATTRTNSYRRTVAIEKVQRLAEKRLTNVRVAAAVRNFRGNGSEGGVRTPDPAVNSRLLYH